MNPDSLLYPSVQLYPRESGAAGVIVIPSRKRKRLLKEDDEIVEIITELVRHGVFD